MRVLSLTSMLAFAAAAASAGQLPTFPLDWTAITTSSIAINQGGVTNPDGSVCCPPNAPQCKVQTAYQAAKSYNDITNKRTAMKNPDNSGIVVLIADLKEYSVNSTGYCQEYCPIDPNQAGGYLQPLGFPNATMDKGSTVYKGIKVEDYRWIDAPLFNITFETTDFYVDINNFTNAIPVYLNDILTPFGMPMGQQQQEWFNFVAGAPDAKAFTVLGKDTCPMSQNCGGNDDAPQDDFNHNKGDLAQIARDLLRFPGLADSSFASRHLSPSNRIEDLRQQAAKSLPSDKSLDEVMQYYSSKLSYAQRRMLDALQA